MTVVFLWQSAVRTFITKYDMRPLKSRRQKAAG